jgi:hypothetical protein
MYCKRSSFPKASTSSWQLATKTRTRKMCLLPVSKKPSPLEQALFSILGRSFQTGVLPLTCSLQDIKLPVAGSRVTPYVSPQVRCGYRLTYLGGLLRLKQFCQGLRWCVRPVRLCQESRHLSHLSDFDRTIGLSPHRRARRLPD